MSEKIFKVNEDFELLKEVSREDFQAKHTEICEKIMETFKRKNHDYGNVFEQTMGDYGLLAPVVRFRDKLGRIETLLTVKNKVMDESIADTILDLGNYCIMTYAALQCINDYKESLKCHEVEENTDNSENSVG